MDCTSLYSSFILFVLRLKFTVASIFKSFRSIILPVIDSSQPLFNTEPTLLNIEENPEVEGIGTL